MKLLILSLVACFVFAGCDGSAGRSTGGTEMPTIREIKILENGYINGQDYVMFQDGRSDTRILAYKGGLVVLPKTSERDE